LKTIGWFDEIPMSIRTKMILIVLPLILGPLIITGYVASLTARNGITQVVTSFLQFKEEELLSYADGQWSLLVDNNLAGNSKFVDATKSAVESFARNMIRSDTELIMAVDGKAEIVMSTADIELSPEEKSELSRLIAAGGFGWRSLALGGVDRVCQIASFRPFGWHFLVTERRTAFYSAVNDLYWRTGIILAVSLAVSVALLLAFSYILISPLRRMVGTIKEIMATSDLSKKVEVGYRDELGELGHTFNLMTEQLYKSDELVKGFALQAVVAQHKEQKIRNIFQKYVPKNVIDQLFANPESMLVGEDRVLALLFSDIRGFTSISEKMAPNEVVESLNAYFGLMVDVIMSNSGIVDKYMGDAIMAFYGAPVASGDEAYQAVKSAFEMIDALGDFNVWQARRGRPEFRTGIGINYGLVTVGNIGSEKKMDYTVIGDMVNIASRLEGLTKLYRQSPIFSESVAEKVGGTYRCRLLDRVVVKGKSSGIGVYTARRTLNAAEERAWKASEEGMKAYFARDFAVASGRFREVLELLPDDGPAALLLERCAAFLRSPPPADWTGAAVMQEK
jgi:class 3 adenylate cyclase/HAMP domain-containing protein